MQMGENLDLEKFIPKSRFDEVNTERKRLEQEAEVLKETARENEGLREEIARLKTDYAVTDLLRAAGAINPATVKPLLDLAEFDASNEENVLNLKAEIEKLAADNSTAFLFKSAASYFKGAVPDEGRDGLPSGALVNGFGTLESAIAKHLYQGN